MISDMLSATNEFYSGTVVEVFGNPGAGLTGARIWVNIKCSRVEVLTLLSPAASPGNSFWVEHSFWAGSSLLSLMRRCRFVLDGWGLNLVNPMFNITFKHWVPFLQRAA